MSDSRERKKQKFRLVRMRLRYLFLILSIFTPLVFLLLLGVIAWLDFDDRWLILLGLMLFSISTGLVYKYLSKPSSLRSVDISEDFQPSNQESWGTQEEQIWEEAKAEAIRRIDLAPDLMDVIQRHPLALADFVAAKYNGRSRLEINPLEALTLIEEVSRRYRLLLQERFPFVEEITLKRANWMHQASTSDTFKALKKYSPWVIHAYQALTNPAGKAVETIFGDVKGELLDESIKKLQIRLKQLFLFECVEVLMDLYSGRFLIAKDSLGQSYELNSDDQNLDEGLEPLRIVVIGQVSSGKSTLVNRICGDVVAEVDMLPTTDKRTVYEITLASGVGLRLCDLPGIDNNTKITDQLFNEVISCDLVIWCLKATQSAKSLDQQLSQRLEAFFDDPKNVALKPPKKLGVLTHSDLLAKSASENEISAAHVVEQAVLYNAELISLDSIEPLSQDSDLGLDKIQALIEIYLEESLQVQLNRRRKASSKTKLSAQMTRLLKGASGLTNLFG